MRRRKFPSFLYFRVASGAAYESRKRLLMTFMFQHATNIGSVQAWSCHVQTERSLTARVSYSRNVFACASRKRRLVCLHVTHSFINRARDQIARGPLSLTTAGLLVTLNGKVTRLIAVYVIRRSDRYRARKNVAGRAPRSSSDVNRKEKKKREFN